MSLLIYSGFKSAKSFYGNEVSKKFKKQEAEQNSHQHMQSTAAATKYIASCSATFTGLDHVVS